MDSDLMLLVCAILLDDYLFNQDFMDLRRRQSNLLILIKLVKKELRIRRCYLLLFSRFMKNSSVSFSIYVFDVAKVIALRFFISSLTPEDFCIETDFSNFC